MSNLTYLSPYCRLPFHDENIYRFETYRLLSYVGAFNWPLESPSSLQLMYAGFYYTGENSTVQCFDCGIIIREWLPDDVPWTKHRSASPLCRFVRNMPCGNVPLRDYHLVVPIHQAYSDVRGYNDTVYFVEMIPNVASPCAMTQDYMCLEYQGYSDYGFAPCAIQYSPDEAAYNFHQIYV